MVITSKKVIINRERTQDDNQPDELIGGEE